MAEDATGGTAADDVENEDVRGRSPGWRLMGGGGVVEYGVNGVSGVNGDSEGGASALPWFEVVMLDGRRSR